MTDAENGQKLRILIEAADMTQLKALEVFNKRQARPLSVSQWKAYLAAPDSARRSPCPDAVLTRAQKLFESASCPGAILHLY